MPGEGKRAEDIKIARKSEGYLRLNVTIEQATPGSRQTPRRFICNLQFLKRSIMQNTRIKNDAAEHQIADMWLFN
jgi:hypothetical protein